MSLTVLLVTALASVAAHARVLPVGEWKAPDFCHDKACPQFYNRTAETPYEIRDYKPTVWAGYHVEESGFVVSEGKAYTQLTRYFKGANVGDVHLDLTTPAVTNFIPSDSDFSASNQSYTVFFYLPDEAPKPQVDGVFLKEIPAFSAYVRSFGGFATESTILFEAKTLRDQLVDDKVDFDGEHFAFATYDTPARLFARHNEVSFISAGSHHHHHHHDDHDHATPLMQLQQQIAGLYQGVKAFLG